MRTATIRSSCLSQEEKLGVTMSGAMEHTPLTFRYVSPISLEGEQEQQQLEEDLKQMGCVGFLARPWYLKELAMVKELSEDQGNEWKGTVWALLGEWTPTMWRKTYNFEQGGDTFASRTDKFYVGKFYKPTNPKDSFQVTDCKLPRDKRLLHYVLAILSPERPTRVTNTLANTIFGTFSGDRQVDWGLVMRDLMNKMVSGIGKSKPFPISPFLFHLYHSMDLLRKTKRDAYEVAAAMIEYEIENPDAEDDPEGDLFGQNGEEDDDMGPGEDPTGQEGGEDNPSADDPVEEEGAKEVDPVWDMDPLAKIIQGLSDYREKHGGEKRMVQELCQLLGNIPPNRVLDQVRGLIRDVNERPEKSEVEKLSKQITTLRKELQLKQVEVESERRYTMQVVNTLGEIREFITHLDEVINKVMLFDRKVLEVGKAMGPQLLTALIRYNRKMETTLVKWREVAVEIGLGFGPETKMEEVQVPKPMDIEKTPPPMVWAFNYPPLVNKRTQPSSRVLCDSYSNG